MSTFCACKHGLPFAWSSACSPTFPCGFPLEIQYASLPLGVNGCVNVRVVPFHSHIPQITSTPKTEHDISN